MGKKICIFGGSGFVGRAITRNAIAHGHTVTVACRHPQRARALLVEGARLARADIATGRHLEEAIGDADCVINLVGILFEKGSYTFEAVHVHGTEHVLAACRQAGVAQYLHMSALGASPDSPSIYARTKAAAEEHVRRSGLNWAIFRPSIIYGDGDSFFNKFKRMSTTLPFVPLIEGDARFQPVWVEDVARAFVMSVGNRRVRGRIFELGGPKTYSFRELLEYMLKVLGRRRLLIPVPRPLARMLAFVLQFLPRPPLTPDQLLLLQRDNVVEGDPPFPPEFGHAAALEDILPTYLPGGRPWRWQSRLNEERKRYWFARWRSD